MENPSNPYSSSLPPRRAEISFDSISQAWTVLKPNLGPWIGATLIYLLVLGAINALLPKDSRGQPQFGAAYSMITLLSIVIGQFFTGGLIRMAIGTVRTGRAEFGLLFSAFDVLPTLLGATLGATILISIASIFGFALCIVPGLLLSGLFMFVVPLIVDQKRGALDAISTSFNTLKPQMWMALLYIIVIGLVGSAGVLACCVGIVVTLPLTFLALAITYRDFFDSGTPQPQGPFAPIAPIADPRG